MPLTPPVNMDDAPESARAEMQKIAESLGREDVPIEFKMMTGSPTFMRDAFANQQALLKADGPHLDRRQREAITLAVSSANNCKSCVKTHVRSAQRHGWTVDQTTAILGITAACCMLNAYHTTREQAVDDMPQDSGLSFGCLTRPEIAPIDSELVCVAVSSVNNCKACLAYHRGRALKHGATTAQIVETYRVAAAMTLFNAYFRIQQ